jgi:hypothetical protein
MASLGYINDQDPKLARFEKAVEMHHGTTGVRVEVHTALIPRRLALSFESVWERAGSVMLAGTPIRALALEDLFIYLCAHGGKHRWQRLQWICDIAEISRPSHDISWTTVRERAHALGALRLVCLGFAVAEIVLGASIPAVIRQDVDSATRRLAERLTSQLFTAKKQPLSEVESRMIELAARERLRDRAIILLRTAISRYRRPERLTSRRSVSSALKLIRRVLFSQSSLS